MESFNICNEYLVASRERNHNRISLVNNYQEVPELKQINNIDDATKIVMRGDK